MIDPKNDCAPLDLASYNKVYLQVATFRRAPRKYSFIAFTLFAHEIESLVLTSINYSNYEVRSIISVNNGNYYSSQMLHLTFVPTFF